MNMLLGNIVATIVGGVIVLITLAMQIRAQELTVDANVSYAAKKQSLTTAGWMYDDLVNVGWGVAPGGTTLEAPTHDSKGRTRRFAFFRRYTAEEAARVGTPADTTAPKRFVYQLTYARRVRIGGSATWDSLFQVVRCVQASGGCPASARGGSSNRLTTFRLDSLKADGAPATPDSARLVRFRFAATVPLAEDRPRTYLRSTFYGTTLALPER